MKTKSVYRLVEDFRQLMTKANQKQNENIPKEQKNNEMKQIIGELESLITPITKELGQKTEKEYLPLQTKFADLLTEYQYLENQYKDQSNEGEEIQQIQIMDPQLKQKIEIYSYDDEYKHEQQDSLQEMQQVDLGDHLTMIEEETRNIAASVRELNEVAELVHNELQNQHNTIRSIEATTSETVETMEKGNKYLDDAKKDQSKCRI